MLRDSFSKLPNSGNSTNVHGSPDESACEQSMILSRARRTVENHSVDENSDNSLKDSELTAAFSEHRAQPAAMSYWRLGRYSPFSYKTISPSSDPPDSFQPGHFLSSAELNVGVLNSSQLAGEIINRYVRVSREFVRGSGTQVNDSDDFDSRDTLAETSQDLCPVVGALSFSLHCNERLVDLDEFELILGGQETSLDLEPMAPPSSVKRDEKQDANARAESSKSDNEMADCSPRANIIPSRWLSMLARHKKLTEEAIARAIPSSQSLNCAKQQAMKDQTDSK
jgi:hypothetical protein